MPKTTILGSQIRDGQITNIQLAKDLKSLETITDNIITTTSNKVTIGRNLELSGSYNIKASAIYRGSEEINSTYLRLDTSSQTIAGDLRLTIPATGASKAIQWTNATSGDFHKIFTENASGTNQNTRLVFSSGNNAEDYAAFRHTIGTTDKDILEIRSDRIVSLNRVSAPEVGLDNRKSRIQFSEVTNGAKIGFFTTPNIADPTTEEFMTITDTGRVGINTTSPATTLDVNGDVTLRNSAASREFVKLYGYNNTHSLNIGYYGSAPYAYYFNSSDEERSIAFRTNGTEQMRVTKTGVGFKTTSPTQAIDVDGHVRLRQSAKEITIAANETSSVWTHNYGSTDYSIILSPNTAVRHVYWENKLANSITIRTDNVHNQPILVDVVLIGR